MNYFIKLLRRFREAYHWTDCSHFRQYIFRIWHPLPCFDLLGVENIFYKLWHGKYKREVQTLEIEIIEGVE